MVIFYMDSSQFNRLSYLEIRAGVALRGGRTGEGETTDNVYFSTSPGKCLLHKKLVLIRLVLIWAILESIHDI